MQDRRTMSRRRATALFETLEFRRLLSAAFNVTQLTALRNDPLYSSIDGSGVTVAVLDTGVFGSHPDLVGNFLGYVDTVQNRAASAPFISAASQSRDPNGHGSHVTGTIASTNRNIGVANAAKFIAIRALLADGESEPRHDRVAEGLRWVLMNHRTYGIRVVNMSLGRPDINQNSPTDDDQARVMQALEDQGITIVTANGNNYAAFRTPGASTPAVNSTIAVINTWEDTGIGDSFPSAGGAAGFGLYAGETGPRPDQIAATSQRSTLPNQVAAPGSTIHSTWNGSSGQFFNTIPGTSMASPFVAGVVALMQDAAQTFGGSYLTPNQVLTLIKQNGDQITDSPNNTNFVVDDNGNAFDLPETGLTFPRVNVYRTIQAVRSLFVRTPSNPDADNTLTTAVAVPAMEPGDGWIYSARSIGFDGTQSIGAADVDLYKVTLTSAAAINFKVAQASGSPASRFAVSIFDAAGTSLGSVTDPSGYPDSSTIQVPAGTYYFGVSGENNVNYNPTNGSGAAASSFTGNYDFTVTAESPDPNGGIGGSDEVEVLAITDIGTNNVGFVTLSGNIGSDIITSGTKQVGTADVDFYAFVAPDNGFVDIDVKTGILSLDPHIRVFGLEGQEIASDDDSGFGNDARLRISVNKGDIYFLGVSSSEGSNFNPFEPTGGSAGLFATSGAYSLLLEFSNNDSNATAFTPTVLSSLGQLTAAIGSDNNVAVGAGGQKDVDFYLTPVLSTGRHTFAVTAGFESVITLYRFDDVNDELLELGQSTGSTHALTIDALAGDRYWISVTGKGNQDASWFVAASGSGGQTGTYTFGSGLVAATPTNASLAGATTLTSTLQASGNIGTDGNLLRRDPLNDVDLYRYTATASGFATFRASGAGDLPPDVYLRVFDAAGNQLGFNDDASDTTTDSSLTLRVTAGQTYFVGVSGFGDSPQAYNPVTGTGAALGQSAGDYLVRVTEQPFPTISVADASANEGTAVTFTFTLSSSPLLPVTFNYATRNGAALAGTHYQPISGTLTIPAGQITATLTVQTTADGLVSGNRSFFLDLSSPTNSSLARATANGTLVNIDLPDPSISISDASANEGSSLTFTITLSAAASKPVSFQYATRNGAALSGTHYQPLTGTLTIPAGQTTATLTVQSVRDNNVDGGRSFFLDLSSPNNATFSRSTATGQIDNIDIPPDGPDFVPNLFFAPSSLPPGSRRNPVGLSVRNDGNLPSSGSVRIDLFASRDDRFDASDTLVFSTVQRISLRPGFTRFLNLRVPSPTNLTDGDYRLVAVVDTTNAIPERDETNNASIAPQTTAYVAPFIDLSTQVVAVPSSIKPGGRAFATVRLTNNGNVNATGSALVRLLLSQLNPGATELGEVGSLTRKLNLKPNASVNLRIRLTRPPQPATVFLTTQLSLTTNLADRNPDNNNSFSTTPIQLL